LNDGEHVRFASNDLALAILIAVTATAAVIDMRTRRVPNVLTMPLATVGIVMAILGIGHVTVGAAIAGCALGLLLMLPLYALGATGAGDVKLFAAAGALLGPGATITAFLYTAIAGGAVALAVAVRRGTLRQTLVQTAGLTAGGAMKAMVEAPSSNNRFAYASAIAIGTVLAAWNA
jgi:prepilin peptidase CpaA